MKYPRIWTPSGYEMFRITAMEHMLGTSYIGRTFALTTARQGRLAFAVAQDSIYPKSNANAASPDDLRDNLPLRAGPSVLYYSNSIHQPEGPTNGKYDPATAYARSVNNPTKYLTKPSSGGGATYFLMDPSSDSLYDDLSSDAQTTVSAAGRDMDGFYLDNMGWTAVTDSNTYEEVNADGTPTGAGTFLPYNPETGVGHTKLTWTLKTRFLAGRMKESLYRAGPSQSYPLLVNGFGQGSRYFDGTAPTSMLADTSDGGLSEIFCRAPQDAVTAFRSETLWRQDADMVLDMEKRGRLLLCSAKLWQPSLTQAQIDLWERYSFACFLMGAGGYASLMFTPSAVGDATGSPPKRSSTNHNEGQSVFPKYDIDIGPPLAADSYPAITTVTSLKSGGVYKRRFKNGLVIANPTAVAVNNIALGGTFHPGDAAWSPNGNTSPITTISLSAHDAAILIT